MSLHTKLTIIITGSLVSITTLSGLILSSSNSHADSTSATASVTVPDVCTLASTSTNHTDTLNGGTYKENFGGESTVTVTCNDRNGYSVYAVGYSNDIEGTNGLIGTSTGLVIPSGTSTSTNVSNWAMKLTPGTGTFAPTILNGYNNYSLVPTTATKVATLTSDINVSNSSQFKTSYAVAVSPTQAADTYVGKVKYTVVHPNYSNADGTRETYNMPVNFAGSGVSSVAFTASGYPTRTVSTSGGTANLTAGVQYTVTASFTSGYEFVSWALNNSGYGTLGSISTNPTTFTPNASSASAVITITGQEQKMYIQDLTLAQCQVNIGTGGNTANVGDEITVYDKRDEQTYTVRYINGACWMTKNLAIGCNGSGSTYGDTIRSKTLTNSDSNISAATWSTPTLSLDKNDNTTICTTSSTDGCNSYTDARMKCSSTYGAWYNYVAASAGTITGDSDSTVDTYNICPKGWTLPGYDADNSSAGSIQSVTSYKNDFSLVAGGHYYSGAISLAAYGWWWSTTASYSYGGRWSLYGGSSLNTNMGLDRRSGLYIRCIKL